MFFESLKMHQNLSSEQKEFIHNGGIKAEMSIAKWVKLLEPICHYDDMADPVRERITKWRNVSFVTLFLSFFIVTFIISILNSILGVLLVSIPLTIAILLFFLHRLFHRLDVNNNVRKVIFPLLQMLALECGHQKKVKLTINFNKKLANNEISKTTVGHNVKTEFYTYEVLQADCMLVDNTKFSLKVIDVIRKRKMKKRSASGKTKYKTKFKLKRRIAMVMGFNKQSYYVNTNKVGQDNIFKDSEDKITYKQVIKQSAEGQTALIDIEALLEKAHVPYSYLVVKGIINKTDGE